MNSVPHEGRTVVLLHGARGGPPHRRGPPRPRPLDLRADPRFADAKAIRKNRREVIAILDAVIAELPARRLGRAPRPGGRVVGAGAGAGRRPRGSTAGGERRLPGTAGSARGAIRAVGQRAGQLLRRPRAPRRRRRRGSVSTPTRCWRSWRRCAPGPAALRPDRGRGPPGRARSPGAGSRSSPRR